MRKGLSGKANGRYSTGLAMGGKEVRRGIYNTWQNMKQRCLNPNHPKYHRYGGRGIVICDAWLRIEGFLAWATEAGLKEGMTVDRIHNDGNYEPSNCRIVSSSENSRKKSTTKLSREDADKIRERIKLGENEYLIADEYGVVHGTIWFIKNGYTHVDTGMHTKKKRGDS